jgi:hypothetical protein
VELSRNKNADHTGMPQVSKEKKSGTIQNTGWTEFGRPHADLKAAKQQKVLAANSMDQRHS